MRQLIIQVPQGHGKEILDIASDERGSRNQTARFAIALPARFKPGY